MLSTIKEFFGLLTQSQRRRFYTLQILVVFMALAEVAGVAAIGPFMMLISDPSMLEGTGKLAELYQASGLQSHEDFMFALGLGVLLVLVLGSMVSVLATWKLARYSSSVGAEIGSRLYRYYMHQNWLYHASTSSSTLTSKVAADATRVTNQILTPLMQINARAVLCLFMLITVVLYNPEVGLIGAVVLVSAYLIIYRLVRARLDRSGKAVSQEQTIRYRLMSEGFGGVKDVLLLNRQKNFTHDFQQSSARFARRQSNIQILAQIPRYMIEVIAFSALIFLTLYLLKTQEQGAGTLLASLAVYGLAGFKLVPAFQAVYSQFTTLKGGLPAFENLKQDLYNCQSFEKNQAKAIQQQVVVPQKLISLSQISFTYPNKEKPALNQLNLEIPVNKTIGLVGPSGSGKSTAIDMLLGLLTPDAGSLVVDGVVIDDANRIGWQKSLGYVPQSIFLSGASVKENVAFGLPAFEIDENLVKKAITMAHLDEVVNELPQGIETTVGERGVQLSGGQRQRIGIARALYHNAEVLVLDEATSALDGLTEKLIMEAVQDFAGKKTIVMIAHRLATVKECDIIYLMQDGNVVASGSYDELIKNNKKFKEMANHA